MRRINSRPLQLLFILLQGGRSSRPWTRARVVERRDGDQIEACIDSLMLAICRNSADVLLQIIINC